MNRVVCCSPDGIALAAQAARLARRSLVLSFPRDVIWMRVGLGLMNVGLRVARRPFRVFVHPPADLVRACESAGMSLAESGHGALWAFVATTTIGMTELGLFPLPLVLLPSEHVPLHIFEERYKDLIGECLEDDSEFGLVFADEVGIREIGTRAAVLEVLTRFEDGRMNIVIEGRDRFRLHDLTDGEKLPDRRRHPASTTRTTRPSRRPFRVPRSSSAGFASSRRATSRYPTPTRRSCPTSSQRGSS